MARRARVDLVNAQKDIKVPKGVNVTWHNSVKEATITAATDILLNEFKTNAKSTTEIIPKFEFTPPAPIPIPPTKSGTPLESDKLRQAQQEIAKEDKDAIDARVDTKYDALGGTREP